MVMFYCCTCGLYALTVWGLRASWATTVVLSPCRSVPTGVFSNGLKRIYSWSLICFWIIVWTICLVWWSWKEFLPLPWLYRRHSHRLHDKLSSSVLYGDLSSVCRGFPGWMGVTGAVCPLTAWLCVAGVGSFWWCRSSSWWVLLPI